MRLPPLDGVGKTLADRAYEAIIDGLLTRRIGPGDPLIMDELAADLEISRTPVRDALQRLEAEGLLESRGRRGFEVRSIDDNEIRLVYQAREAVEGYAARVMAERAGAGAGVVASMRAAVEEAAGLLDGTLAGSYHANRAIHRAIVDAVGNRYLTASFDSIWGASLAALSYQHFDEVAFERSQLFDLHEPLLDALDSGDGRVAEAAMLDHIADGLTLHLGANPDL